MTPNADGAHIAGGSQRSVAALAAPLLAMLLLALAGPPAAHARSSDRDAEVRIAADHSQSVLDGEGELVLSGNVRIDQGTLRIRAREATVSMAGGEIRRIVFSGTPATMQQQADDGAMMRASARGIEYGLDQESVLLTGEVVVEQPSGSLRGERVRYDLATEQLEAGGSSGIRMVIPPRARAATDATPAAAADDGSGNDSGTDEG